MSVAFDTVCRGLVAIALIASSPAGAAPLVPPLSRDAPVVADVGRHAYLGAALAGTRVVAVGERGLVALSDDSGRTWRQAGKVPVSVTLTGVEFVTTKKGWAIGHAGVVLTTDDAGETWRRQLDGITLAEIAKKEARRYADSAGSDAALAERLSKEANLLTSDGPDKPFLDLKFQDAQHGMVVGAYNLIYVTSDGGDTWHAWMGHTDNPKGLHLYAIRRDGNTIFIAGEQGLLMRSADGGQTFARIASPYEGSWFAIASSGDQSIVVAGLRGNAFRSNDGGDSWSRLAGAQALSITSAAPDHGRLLLANQAGTLYVVSPSDNTLQPLKSAPLPTVSKLLPLADGSLLAMTMQGPMRVALAAASAMTSAAGR